MEKVFNPNFHTPDDQLCKEELNKRQNWPSVAAMLHQEFRNDEPDLTWEAEQLAKSFGVYLEFDRSVKAEKHWMFMVRISNPGGGPISPTQWLLLDELSEKYGRDPAGNATLRLTSRQNIQFHWVKKTGVIEIIKRIAETGLRSLNGCGDNTRNVLACPISRFSPIYNGVEWARKTGEYFQLPVEPFIKIFAIDPTYVRQPEDSFHYGPQLLNRKFKIAFSALHQDEETGEIVPDNCVELLTNDMGIAPIWEKDQVKSFQIYLGGGQGERNGQLTTAALGLPLGIVSEKQLLPTMNAVIQVHQEWGDRQTRHWARLKYVIKKMGIDWFRERVNERLDFKIKKPKPRHDYGVIHRHHGWIRQPGSPFLTYGLFLENGRISDVSQNGRIKTMIRELVQKYPVELMTTPNQDLLFTNLPEAQKEEFTRDLQRYQYGLRDGKPFSRLRLQSGACVGRDTCRLTYTDSEQFEPELMDELGKLGWGDLDTTIGITGCERQCFRPATKAIGLVGSGNDRYLLKLMGTEDGRHLGKALICPDTKLMYMIRIPRNDVVKVIHSLLQFHTAKRKPGETLGYFNRRVGMKAIIKHFKKDPATAEMMKITAKAESEIE